MPFLKVEKVSVNSIKEWKSKKNGLRHAVFKIGHGYYTGYWKDNQKNGDGYFMSKEARYEGGWKNDLRSGFGIQSNKRKDGSYDLVYYGLWKNGKAEGDGLKHFRDGSIYDGSWVEGKRQGWGRMWYADGSYYDGEWSKGAREGIGLFVYSNGNRYEGEWSSGVKNGKGMFYHLGTGQNQEGYWSKDSCITSSMTDSAYRQAACEPTPYSIPRLCTLTIS